MIQKILVFLLFLAVLAHGYTEENGILVLEGKDLDTITETFPNLFIEFYVPWCKHCRKLAPVLDQIAEELKKQQSPIRIAKMNCEDHQQGYDFAKIQGFPTLIYYQKGQPVYFDGDRTKDYLLKWLTKRIDHPVKQITKEQLQELKKSQSEDVSIVFIGSLKSIRGSEFTNLAYQDNYNKYYFIEQQIMPYGTVLLFRSFAEDIQYPSFDDKITYWILQNDRPAVAPLDDRSISYIFRDGHKGVFFFIDPKHAEKRKEFEEAVKEWKIKGNPHFSLTFIAVTEDHEDYFGLLQYLKMNPLEQSIVIINGGQQQKYIFEKSIKDLKASHITEFLNSVESGEIIGKPMDQHQHNHDHHHHDHDHDHDHDHNHHHHHHHDHDHDHEHNHHDDDHQLHHHDHDHHSHDHDHFHEDIHDHIHHFHHQQAANNHFHDHAHAHVHSHNQHLHNQHQEDHEHHGDDCPHHSHHQDKAGHTNIGDPIDLNDANEHSHIESKTVSASSKNAQPSSQL